MEDDRELNLINARKMAELKRRMEQAAAAKAPKPPEKTNREVLAEKLFDRGGEVLDAAYSNYPSQTPLVVDQLARYIKKNPGMEKISGGELLEVFRSLGLRFSLKTSIKVQERGKFVDLAEKFKLKQDEEDQGR